MSTPDPAVKSEGVAITTNAALDIASERRWVKWFKTARKGILEWFNPHEQVEYMATIIYSASERQAQILKIIDDRGFNGRIFFVAGSGFLASSYSLFSTTVVTPALYFVYPPCGQLNGEASLIIDNVTLTGTVIGMLLVGHLSDLFGRKKLYGIELAILIFATFGLVQAGAGYMYNDGSNYSMDIYSWISWWRFLLGFAIGAADQSLQYPISAVITVEWASTESRGTMLAAVKSMQSFARLLAYAIGLGALRNTVHTNGVDPNLPQHSLVDLNDDRVVVDRVWRSVIGIAVVPAAVAIVLRWTIPETPRYYSDILKDLRKAIKNALHIYPTVINQPEDEEDDLPDHSSPQTQDSNQFEQWLEWYRGAWRYLTKEKPEVLRHLVCISLLWALMDVGFYSISLDSYNVMATLSAQGVPAGQNVTASNLQQANNSTCTTMWRASAESPDTTIYQMLEHNSIRSLEIVAVSSVLGSLVAVSIVHIFRRRYILVVTFLLVAILFAIAGATLYARRNMGDDHTATIVFYSLAQFVYNIGPNAMIFVTAAEIFPTVYRGTFFAIAAASGKVGAIIIRSISGKTGNKIEALSIRLLAVIPFMLIAAALSWFLPRVQYEAGEERSLPSAEQRQDTETAPSSLEIDASSWAYKYYLRFKLKNKPLEEIAPQPDSFTHRPQED